MQRPVELIELRDLSITEETEPEQALTVARMILRTGAWTRPIAVEREHHAIMDGHHRYAAAVMLGLSRIPCVFYRYHEVEVYPRREEEDVRPVEILRRAREMVPYPPKTTRHVFPDGLHDCNVALGALRSRAFSGHHELVWSRVERGGKRVAAGGD